MESIKKALWVYLIFRKTFSPAVIQLKPENISLI